MKSGRRLDALIAEEAMGISITRMYLHFAAHSVENSRAFEISLTPFDQSPEFDNIPTMRERLSLGITSRPFQVVAFSPEPRPYSTDSEAANEVRLKLQERGHHILFRPSEAGGFIAFLDVSPPLDWTERGETAAHAICLAALRALKT